MLADADELAFIVKSQLSPPRLRPAAVGGGKLASDRILVDGNGYDAMVQSGAHFVPGKAYLVETVQIEDALRYAVTETYEVFRCEVRMLETNEVVKGLTFRYRGA